MIKAVFKWLKQRQLHFLLEKLASYNDKGIAWSKHSPSVAEEERERLINLIKDKVASLDSEDFSDEFIEALGNGSLKIDASGKYIQYRKM